MSFDRKTLVGLILSMGALASPIASADQCDLPSSDEFINILRICGAGSNYKLDGSIQREARSIYENGRTAGKATEEITASVIAQLPQGERLAGYRDYLGCVNSLLKQGSLGRATLTLEYWNPGGWRALVTNPTGCPVAITDPKLIAVNPNKGSGSAPYDFAYSLKATLLENGRNLGGTMAPKQAARLYLALFGPAELCNNWKELRANLFTPRSEFKDFGKWTCKVELNLVSASGTRARINEEFECARIPVPPPRC